jgi:hypothetical protein
VRTAGSLVATIEEVRMVSTEGLRPVERRVVRWAESGLDDAEIGRRFGRGERWTAQVRFLAELDRPRPQASATEAEASGDAGTGTDAGATDALRPLERRLLRWRERGVDHVELSTRFRRSPGHLARVEELAHYKLSAAS